MAAPAAIVLKNYAVTFQRRMFKAPGKADSHAMSLEKPITSELSNARKAWSVLIVSTLAFTDCFMVWMMFGVIGIPIKRSGCSPTPIPAMRGGPRQWLSN